MVRLSIERCAFEPLSPPVPRGTDTKATWPTSVSGEAPTRGRSVYASSSITRAESIGMLITRYVLHVLEVHFATTLPALHTNCSTFVLATKDVLSLSQSLEPGVD